MELKAEIGSRVSKIRCSLNLNKKEFARLIGMKEQYLGTVESGKKGLTVEKVVEICDKTGVSADYLLLGISNTIEETIKENFSDYTDEQVDTACDIVKKALLLFK